MIMIIIITITIIIITIIKITLLIMVMIMIIIIITTTAILKEPVSFYGVARKNVCCAYEFVSSHIFFMKSTVLNHTKYNLYHKRSEAITHGVVHV